jgi:hypothetical protein
MVSAVLPPLKTPCCRPRKSADLILHNILKKESNIVKSLVFQSTLLLSAGVHHRCLDGLWIAIIGSDGISA